MMDWEGRGRMGLRSVIRHIPEYANTEWGMPQKKAVRTTALRPRS